MKNNSTSQGPYQFKKISEYISYLKKFSPNTGKELSFAQIAHQLSIKSPRLISMVANGHRLPSSDFLEKISTWAKLTITEKRYLDLIVKREKLENNGEKTNIVDDEIKNIVPQNYKIKIMNAEELIESSKWYFLVIKQLTSSPKFNLNTLQLQNALRNKVTKSQISITLKKLVEFGILKMVNSEKFQFKSNICLRSSDDLPSREIRNHHKIMLKRAIEAIEEQNIEEREYQSLTLRIDPQKIGELKKEMREFIHRINSKYTTDNEEILNTYQLNLNLFEHTDKDFL